LQEGLARAYLSRRDRATRHERICSEGSAESKHGGARAEP